jgi:hypothetical protein
MDTIEQSKSGTENSAISEPLPSQPPQTKMSENKFDVARIAAFLFWIKNVFDYLGGSCEEPPAGMPFLTSPLWTGLWWGLMIGLILLFCGQTSKFIYIDF